MALLAIGCVAPAEVPQGNVRLEEEDIIRMAIDDVLETERLEVANTNKDQKMVRTAWNGDETEQTQVSVMISHTSMGFALATRVRTAIPANDTTAPADVIMIGGQSWRLDGTTRDREKAEERRLGMAIQNRWQELKRELRMQEPPR